MEKTFFAAVLASLYVYASAIGAEEAKPKYGPAKAPVATPLSMDNGFFKKNPANDFWLLIPYYSPQLTPYTCSAASIAIVLNGAKAKAYKSEDDENITEKSLLDKVGAEHFRELLSEKGFEGRHGLSIEALGKVVEAALKAFNIPYASVKTQPLNREMPDLAEKKKELLEILQENENSSRDFIIAHFNQSVYTGADSGAHISPVGAFDAKNKRILILDVDRQWYEPYWVSFDDFFKGLSEPSRLYGGYANGGYVWIRLKQD